MIVKKQPTNLGFEPFALTVLVEEDYEAEALNDLFFEHEKAVQAIYPDNGDMFQGLRRQILREAMRQVAAELCKERLT